MFSYYLIFNQYFGLHQWNSFYLVNPRFGWWSHHQFGLVSDPLHSALYSTHFTVFWLYFFGSFHLRLYHLHIFSLYCNINLRWVHMSWVSCFFDRVIRNIIIIIVLTWKRYISINSMSWNQKNDWAHSFYSNYFQIHRFSKIQYGI